MALEKYFSMLTSWKFWVIFIFVLAVVFSLPFGLKGSPVQLLSAFAFGLIYLPVMVILAGNGFLYWFDRFGIPINIGIVYLVYAFWPLVIGLIWCIISNKSDKRIVVTLSIIVILLLILGFSGCAVLRDDLEAASMGGI